MEPLWHARDPQYLTDEVSEMNTCESVRTSLGGRRPRGVIAIWCPADSVGVEDHAFALDTREGAQGVLGAVALSRLLHASTAARLYPCPKIALNGAR